MKLPRRSMCCYGRESEWQEPGIISSFLLIIRAIGKLFHRINNSRFFIPTPLLLIERFIIWFITLTFAHNWPASLHHAHPLAARSTYVCSSWKFHAASWSASCFPDHKILRELPWSHFFFLDFEGLWLHFFPCSLSFPKSFFFIDLWWHFIPLDFILIDTTKSGFEYF